uniref:Uncharacterized protein n=1 Tax=Caenorhabditis japonica TaxID=281687 RepID=A0A8R1DQ04_CAEJA
MSKLSGQGSPDEDPDTDDTDIYRKKVSTFRRRNINSSFGGGRIPFSRMAYKSGYGSNRIGFSRNAGVGYYGERNSNPNPYGTMNIGGVGGPYQPHVPEEYNMRPSAPYSGLIGGSRAGYYGSTVGMRRGGVQPMSSRKPNIPSVEYPCEFPSFPRRAFFARPTRPGQSEHSPIFPEVFFRFLPFFPVL